MAERFLMKRKGVEQDWDYSDFPLSCPSRKIRRLDADVVPVMDTGYEAFPLVVEQQLLTDQVIGGTTEVSSSMEEAIATPSLNEDMTLVWYKPVDNQFVISPSSCRVNSDLISALKGQSYWQDNKKLPDSRVESTTNYYMAVVPWVQSPTVTSTIEVEAFVSATAPAEDAMEDESTSMDVEEDMEQTVTGMKIESKVSNNVGDIVSCLNSH